MSSNIENKMSPKISKQKEITKDQHRIDEMEIQRINKTVYSLRICVRLTNP